MKIRVIIDIGELPKKQLIECNQELLQMAEGFSQRHPDISAPRAIIEFEDIHNKQLSECYTDIKQMMNEFSKKHPDIFIPSDALRAEGSLLGFNFAKGVFF